MMMMMMMMMMMIVTIQAAGRPTGWHLGQHNKKRTNVIVRIMILATSRLEG